MDKIITLMQNQLPFIGFIWALVAIAMVIDLATGIKKAHKRGEATTSNGLRKTCKKAEHYFVPLAAASVLDMILCIIPQYELPWGSLGYGIFCAATEFFSVFENTHTKNERKDVVSSISMVLNTLDDKKELIKEISNRVLEGDDAQEEDIE